MRAFVFGCLGLVSYIAIVAEKRTANTGFLVARLIITLPNLYKVSTSEVSISNLFSLIKRTISNCVGKLLSKQNYSQIC